MPLFASRLTLRLLCRRPGAAVVNSGISTKASMIGEFYTEYSAASIEWLVAGLFPEATAADVDGLAESDAEAMRKMRPRGGNGSRAESSFLSSSSSRSASLPRHDVLELGAGTGQLSRAVLDARPGLRIVGVDSSTEKCVEYGARLVSVDGTTSIADVLQGTAEKIPLLDSSVGAVIAGRSFYSFASTVALAEISRVLVPGGALGLIWNTWDTSVSWVQALDDVISPYCHDGSGSIPQHHRDEWKKMFDSVISSPDSSDANSHPLFDRLESKRLLKVDLMTEDDIVNHVVSLSVIAAQGSHVQNDVAARVRDLLATDSSVERDGGCILLPYITEMYLTANLKEDAVVDSMQEALNARVDKIASSALHLDDFFGGAGETVDEEDEDDEDFVDYTDEQTGEWNGPTRGGRRPEPTRHGDWHVMGRCTDF